MRYIWLTIKHKFFVFQAGLKIGVPLWQLIIHDWSKFLLWREYNNAFFGDKSMDKEFAEAWLYHQNHEKHHWEYWIPRTSHSKQDPTMQTVAPLRIPMRYVKEMVADWMGAGRAYNGEWPDIETSEWFLKNKEFIWSNLHPETQVDVMNVIRSIKK